MTSFSHAAVSSSLALDLTSFLVGWVQVWAQMLEWTASMTPGCCLPRSSSEGPTFPGCCSVQLSSALTRFSDWVSAGLGTNGVDSEQDPRLLSSREFLRELSFWQLSFTRPVLSQALSCHKLSGWVGAGLGTNAGVDSEHDPRLLSSREFLRELGKGAGARKELSALSLRWINLRGMPHITAAFTYNK